MMYWYTTDAWFFLIPHNTVVGTIHFCQNHYCQLRVSGSGYMTVARSVSLVDLLTLLLGNWFWYTTVFRAIIHRGDTPLGHPNYQIGTIYL